MKKYVWAIVGIHLMILVSGVFQSCCREEHRITSDGYLRALYDPKDELASTYEIEVISGPFTLIADFSTEVATLPSSTWMSSAYATKCNYPIINEVQKESIDLSVDQPIVWNGDTLPSNTNLLELSNSGIELPEAYPSSVEFDFTQAFFDQVILIAPEYTFNFSALTSDGVQLDASLALPVE